MEVITTAQYTIAILNDGATGAKGEDAIVAVLDNDSHVVPTDVNGEHGNYAGATSSLIIFKGATEDTENWEVLAISSKGIKGSFDETTNTYTITGMDKDTDNGIVEFFANKTGSSPIHKIFSITKSKKGAVGESAVTYSLALDVSHIQRDGLEKTLTPSSISIDGQAKTGDGGLSDYEGYFVVYEQSREALTVDEYTKLIADSQAQEEKEYILSDLPYPYVKRYTSQTKEAALDYKIQTDAVGIRIEWYKDEELTNLLDLQTVPIVSDGMTTHVHLAYAENELGTEGFSTEYSEGIKYMGQYTSFYEEPSVNPSDYTWALIKGADGYTPIKGTDYFDGEEGQNGVSSYLWIRYAQKANPTNAEMTTNPTNALYIGTSTTTEPQPPTLASAYQWVLIKGKDGIPGEDGVTGETTYLHIRYSNDGGATFTSADGETAGMWIGMYTDTFKEDSTSVSTYTWNKVKGDDSTSYTLITSPTVIKKSAEGVLSPSVIVATAKSQTGTKAVATYKGRFTIESDTGSGYTSVYTSSLDESTRTYVVPSGAIQTRVRLYQAGGTNTLLDEQTIATVADGADGTVLIINSPKGTTIRNGEGTLTAAATLYKGAKEVAGTTYQWYELDPSGVGDTDSGAGWNKLSGTYTGSTSGYFTKTLTITASAITDTATYMVIVTYGGMKYKQQITVNDITDPYDVRVLGNEFFKNAQGTNTYTAKIFQSGDEIDKSGSLYHYQWHVYKSTGLKDDTFSKVGKTITVSAAEYDGKGELRCTVSD